MATPAPTLAVELTRDTYADLAARRTFVLPIGILEEHGPHLPLGTDGFQVEAVVLEAAARTGAVVLPTLWYGNAVSTRPFPGTISISVDTLRAVVRDILSELARHGVCSVAIVSGHAGGGHMAFLKQAARDALQDDLPLRVAVLSEWDALLGLEEVAGIRLPPGDGHAGAMESARMLDLRPELVGDLPGPLFPEDAPSEVSIAPLPDGYGGDPSLATAKLGRALHERCVEALVELFDRLTPSD